MVYLRLGKWEFGNNPAAAAADAALQKVHQSSLHALFERAAEMTANEIAELQLVIDDSNAAAAKAEEILAKIIARETEKRDKAVSEANAVVTATGQEVKNAQRVLDMMNRELDIKAGK